MNYTKMLNKLIKESNMSQKEISNKCKELGEEVTTTYLSALKNTEGKMASENISRAIAKACNAKYEEILVVQAYLDKAPKFIIDFFMELKKKTEQETEFSELIIASKTMNQTIFKNEIDRIKQIKSLAEFICEYKGTMAVNEKDFNLSIEMIKNNKSDPAILLEKRLIEDRNWLLIPLEDMSKAQIVTQAEAEYIKKTLSKNK